MILDVVYQSEFVPRQTWDFLLAVAFMSPPASSVKEWYCRWFVVTSNV